MDLKNIFWFINAGIAATPPTNQVAPVISGTPLIGETLTTTNGTWTGSPDSYTYQWKRDGVNIGSATNSTYVLVSADVGTDIICTVTATNDFGSGNANSNAIHPSTLQNGLLHNWEGTEGPADWANSVSGAQALTYTAGATPAVLHPFKRGFGTLVGATNIFETASVEASPNGVGSFTVSGWFSINTTGAIQVMSAQWGASNRRWRLYYDKTAGQFKVTLSVNGSATATTLSVTYSETLLLKETTFYVLEHDAENDFIRLKIGNHAALGSFTSTAHSTGIFNGTGQKIGVGRDGGGNTASCWFGMTRVWNRKLTEAEHTELWNYGRGIRSPFTNNDIVLNANQFVFYILPDSQHLLAPSGISAMRTKEWGWNMADMIREVGGVTTCWHVGDVRHKILASDPNVPATWTSGLVAFQFLMDKGVLFGPQYGNHDLDDIGLTGPGRLLTEYHGVFPQSYLSGQSGFNGGFYDSTLDNYYHLFTAGGEDWILISTEAAPRDVILDWAEDLVINNPTRKVIYISHQILSNTTGQAGGATIFMDSNDNTMTQAVYNPMGDRNNGSAQYNQILKPYENSVMFFCGHDNTDPCNGTLELVGDEGNIIQGILRNYQEEDNVSSAYQGWFVVVTVDTQEKTISLKTWNVAQQTYEWTPGNLAISPAAHNVTLNY